MARACASVMRKVLGAAEEEELDAEELAEFMVFQQKWQSKNTSIVLAIAVSLTLYYMFASGFDTLLHVFFRVNNWLSVALFALVHILRKMAPGEGISQHRSWFKSLNNVVSFMGMSHYCIYSTMTWHRVEALLELFTGTQYDTQFDLLGDAYCLMHAIVALAACAHFHILSMSGLFMVAILAPVQWVLQCIFLGSEHEMQDMIKLGGVFVSISIITFLGGRRSNVEHFRDFVRLRMERFQVMRIFRQASAPIFIVSQQPGCPSDLRVELWNSALEELLQAPVPRGTALQTVNCFRSSSCSVLQTAIERALGESAAHTRRMLVPMVAAAGVVWLQVDVSPLSAGGRKAIIIGSDVTEFVTMHLSLLHFVPEEGLGEQHRERPPSQALNNRCSAELDPHALTVLDCSPQFNILLQRRMRGRPFISHLEGADRRSFRGAVEAVLRGDAAEQRLSVCLSAEPASSIRGGSSWRRGQRRSRQAPSQAERQVTLGVSLIREGSAQQGCIAIQIESERSSSQQAAGPEVVLNAGSASDPGGAEEEGEESMLSLRGASVLKVKSDPGAKQAGSDVLQGGLGALAARAPSGTSMEVRGNADDIKMDAVSIHLIDLSRHFSRDTYEESHQLLQAAMAHIGAQKADSAMRWGGPCRHWRCALCNASNDEEDEVCEVCKLGEPEGDNESSMAPGGVLLEL